MPRLEGMYAPGNENAHVLPPAGYQLPMPSDVYRYNRVCPFYPPDPCIRPNEGDFICPPECPPCPRNHPWMAPAGNDTRVPSDVFRFSKVYAPTACNPCRPEDQPYPDASAGPITPTRQCPCTNRPHYPPSKPAKHFEYRYPMGETGCTKGAHKHGHAPADCSGDPNATPICWDMPKPSDCCQPPPIYNPGIGPLGPQSIHEKCPRGQASVNHIPQTNPRDTVAQRYVGESNVPMPQGYPTNRMELMIKGQRLGQGPPMSDAYSSNPQDTSCSRCSSGVSMINHPPKSRQIHDTWCPSDKQNAPNPYAIAGDLTYTSPGYSICQRCKHNQTSLDASRTVTSLNGPCTLCHRLYHPSPYVCRPVYNRKYLLDCPEQDGPPGDSYTFL